MPDTRSSLLIRVRDLQDDRGWVEFDQIYRPMLTDYARSRGLTDQEAEEIAQSCLTAVVQVIGKFKRTTSFRGWLRGMVNRRVAGFLADKRKRHNPGTAPLHTAAHPTLTADEIWEQGWNRAHLMQCIDSVRGGFAAHTFTAFVMYVVQQDSVDQICRALSMTPNQIYVAKNRVVQKLKERFGDVLDGLYGFDA